MAGRAWVAHLSFYLPARALPQRPELKAPLRSRGLHG